MENCKGYKYMTCIHSQKAYGIQDRLVRCSCKHAVRQPLTDVYILRGFNMNLCDTCGSYVPEIFWIIHSIFGYQGLPDGIRNFHTHGLWSNYGHLDLQIVIAMKPEIASALLNTMGERIKNGERFRFGDIIPDLGLMDTRVQEFMETGRSVLRLIIPDPKGRFLDDIGCEEPYRYQMKKMFE